MVMVLKFICLYSELSDGRLLHFIKDAGMLYLSSPDMAMIVPSFEEQLASMKMNIEEKRIDTGSHPHIFLDCVK